MLFWSLCQGHRRLLQSLLPFPLGELVLTAGRPSRRHSVLKWAAPAFFTPLSVFPPLCPFPQGQRKAEICGDRWTYKGAKGSTLSFLQIYRFQFLAAPSFVAQAGRWLTVFWGWTPWTPALLFTAAVPRAGITANTAKCTKRYLLFTENSKNNHMSSTTQGGTSGGHCGDRCLIYSWDVCSIISEPYMDFEQKKKV